MAFHFPLQALLHYRESCERREFLRLEIVSRELTIAREQAEAAKRDRERALEDYTKKLAGGMTASELSFELACDRVRLSRLAACQQQALKLEELRQRQLQVFQKAQQQRKILENLRDRQLAGYRLVQNRREQQQVDERFLILQRGQDSR